MCNTYSWFTSQLVRFKPSLLERLLLHDFLYFLNAWFHRYCSWAVPYLPTVKLNITLSCPSQNIYSYEAFMKNIDVYQYFLYRRMRRWLIPVTKITLMIMLGINDLKISVGFSQLWSFTGFSSWYRQSSSFWLFRSTFSISSPILFYSHSCTNKMIKFLFLAL